MRWIVLVAAVALTTCGSVADAQAGAIHCGTVYSGNYTMTNLEARGMRNVIAGRVSCKTIVRVPVAWLRKAAYSDPGAEIEITVLRSPWDCWYEKQRASSFGVRCSPWVSSGGGEEPSKRVAVTWRMAS